MSVNSPPERIKPRYAKHSSTFFNDLRENKYIPLSEMSKYIAQISEQMVEVTQAVNANAALMNNILQVLRPQQNLDKDPSHLKPPQYFG